MNKRGVSPLTATFFLIVFAMILGAIVMNVGRDYVESVAEISEPTIDSFDDPFEILKIRYAKGEITKEEFEDMHSSFS